MFNCAGWFFWLCLSWMMERRTNELMQKTKKLPVVLWVHPLRVARNIIKPVSWAKLALVAQ